MVNKLRQTRMMEKFSFFHARTSSFKLQNFFSFCLCFVFFFYLKSILPHYFYTNFSVCFSKFILVSKKTHFFLWKFFSFVLNMRRVMKIFKFFSYFLLLKNITNFPIFLLVFFFIQKGLHCTTLISVTFTFNFNAIKKNFCEKTENFQFLN